MNIAIFYSTKFIIFLNMVSCYKGYIIYVALITTVSNSN